MAIDGEITYGSDGWYVFFVTNKIDIDKLVSVLKQSAAERGIALTASKTTSPVVPEAEQPAIAPVATPAAETPKAQPVVTEQKPASSSKELETALARIAELEAENKKLKAENENLNKKINESQQSKSTTQGGEGKEQFEAMGYLFEMGDKKGEVTLIGMKTYRGRILLPSTIEYNDTTYTVTKVSGRQREWTWLKPQEDKRKKPDVMKTSGIGSILMTYSHNYTSSLYPGIFGGDLEIIIPDSVTEIGERAFCGIQNIKIEIPNSVISIGKEAFRGCYYLEKIILPPNISKIKESTFEGCRCLEEVKLPEKLEIIGKHAFYGDSSIDNIEIPSSVKIIDEEAFNSYYGHAITLNIHNTETNIQIAANAISSYYGKIQFVGKE